MLPHKNKDYINYTTEELILLQREVMANIIAEQFLDRLIKKELVYRT